MAADKKLNSVNLVNDASYVYAETASGETVKISKASLASVLSEQMKSLGAIPSDVGVKNAAYWDGLAGDSFAGKIVTGYHTGLTSGIVSIGLSSYTLQISNVYNTGVVKTRTYYSDGGYWTPWKEI